MKNKKTSFDTKILFFLSAVLIGLSVILIAYFISYSKKIGVDEKPVTYEKNYCFIADDPSTSLWQSVYKSALNSASSKGAYVEMLQDTLSGNYSKEELMEIAIDSGFDGIILSAGEGENMTRLINSAYENGIPVVTLFQDNANSMRLSFVGIAMYNLGKEYGNLIVDVVKDKKYSKDTINAMVLIDQGTENSAQNVLTLAIQEVIDKENLENSSKHAPIAVNTFYVDPSNSFSVEESVRNIFMKRSDELPDIIVCLNEIDTTCLYQAVVDYNQVGLITILGYYDSNAILTAIERNVIYASVSVDANQLGEYCIDALSEYYELGNTSQYFVGDISVVRKNNVDYYIRRKQDEK